MKNLLLNSNRPFLLTSLALTLALPADIITLNDGTKLDADILEKTLDELKLDVRITPTIREPRTIKRSDVANIETINERDVIFEEQIKDLFPIPPFSTVETYKKNLEVATAFAEKYPLTTSGGKARDLAKQIEVEMVRIQQGDLRISPGKDGLVASSEIVQNKLHYDALRVKAELDQAIANKKPIAALRAFEELELNFYASKAHKDSVPEIQRLLTSLKALLERDAVKDEAKMMKLEKSSEENRLRAKQNIEKRRQRLAEIWATEKEAGRRWLTLDRSSLNSISRTFQEVEQKEEELKKGAELLSQAPDSGALFKKGWHLAGEKKIDVLEALLEQMDKNQIGETYINALIGRFDPALLEKPAEE